MPVPQRHRKGDRPGLASFDHGKPAPPEEPVANKGENEYSIKAAVDYYRTVTFTSIAILCAALALLAWVAPREYRRLNQRIKQVTLGYTVLTIATAALAIAAAANAVLAAPWVNALMYTFVALAQWIDGLFTWERYQNVFPGYEPPRVTRLAIHSYIFCVLFLPFAMDWELVITGEPKHALLRDDGSLKDTATVVCSIIYMFSVPGRIVWDFGFGVAIFLRVMGLRYAAKDEQRDALLSLSRKILAYTIITTLLNLAIHLPATHFLPYEPVFCMGFHLTLATLTHVFFSAGANAGKWVGWLGILPMGLLHQQSAAAAMDTPAAADAKAGPAPSVLSVPNPFTIQHPRPPLPHTAANSSEAEEAWQQHQQHQQAYQTHGGGRARPTSFVQSRKGVSLFSPSAAAGSPGMRQRRTPRSAGSKAAAGSVSLEIVPSPAGAMSASPRRGGRMVTRAAAAKEALIHHRIPNEERDTEEGMERLG